MLPVDPDRLRREFPALSQDDLDAYVEITERVMAAGKDRPRLMKEILAGARAARERQQKGETLSAQETLRVRYLSAVEKMQATTVAPRS